MVSNPLPPASRPVTSITDPQLRFTAVPNPPPPPFGPQPDPRLDPNPPPSFSPRPDPRPVFGPEPCPGFLLIEQ